MKSALTWPKKGEPIFKHGSLHDYIIILFEGSNELTAGFSAESRREAESFLLGTMRGVLASFHVGRIFTALRDWNCGAGRIRTAEGAETISAGSKVGCKALGPRCGGAILFD